MATSPPSKSVSAVATAKAAMSNSGAFLAEALTPDSTSFPPIYEAAILYSADYYEAAETVLKEYLRTNDGKNSIRAWLMMFDFYQLTHNRKEFDALSMLFTVKFERSPPHWLELSESSDPRRKEKRERKDFFLVTPASDGAILAEIDRFEIFAKELGSARIDFAKIKNILPEESELFAIVLQRIRKLKIPIWFNQLDAFAATLKQGINDKTGRPLNESQGFWSLLFELFILDGRLQEYEDLGLEYAVAFEMSPPAWELVSRPTGASDDGVTTGTDAAAVAPIGFPLKGVISAGNKEMLQQLAIYANNKQEIAVDMSGLMRIDFAATGLFFETIRSIHLSQKRIVLSNLNELVAALLEVFGISKHAIIMRKKTT
jgi:anti-anti-sigma regulatory factor